MDDFDKHNIDFYSPVPERHISEKMSKTIKVIKKRIKNKRPESIVIFKTFKFEYFNYDTETLFFTMVAIIDGIEQSGDALAQFQNDELSPEDVTYNFYPEPFSGN